MDEGFWCNRWLLRVVRAMSLAVLGECMLRCAQINRIPLPQFHLVQPCGFSRAVLVGLTRTSSFERCVAFAHRKRALAFNYNPAGSDASLTSNCLVLDCPEYDIMLSLESNFYFDYYSLYARPLPEENSTCISGVGMFHMHREEANFTDAEKVCESKGGKLANVVSESRTNGLSNLVAALGNDTKLRVAYVGMKNNVSGGPFTSFKEQPLICLPYRAWAPNEPRSKNETEDCVVLDSNRMWRVVDCASKHPFICELNPAGPLNDNVTACPKIVHTETRAVCYVRANFTEFLYSPQNVDRCQRLEDYSKKILNKTEQPAVTEAINSTVVP